MYYCVFLLLIFTPGYANESILSPYPLQSILDNTAAYCERLKTAAFHYSCTEKIVEIIEKYIKGKDIKPDLIRFLTRYKETPSHGKFDNFNTRSERNEFISQYQAIQKDNKIQEQRYLLKHNGKNVLKENAILNTLLYTQNAFLAPLFLFEKKKQDQFDFKILKKEKTIHRDAYVIELRLKSREGENAIFAQAWIDAEDFSVLKFQALPDSFQGYDALLKATNQNFQNVKITDIHYFEYIKDGLRFPSKTEIMVTYVEDKLMAAGKTPDLKVQKRTKITTSFSYNEYIFFNVTVGEPSFEKYDPQQIKTNK